MATKRSATTAMVAGMGLLMLAAGIAAPLAADHSSSKATYVGGTSGSGIQFMGCTNPITEGRVPAGVGGCFISCPSTSICTIRVDDIHRGRGHFYSECDDGSQGKFTGGGHDRKIHFPCPDRHIVVFVDLHGTVGTIEAF